MLPHILSFHVAQCKSLFTTHHPLPHDAVHDVILTNKFYCAGSLLQNVGHLSLIIFAFILCTSSLNHTSHALLLCTALSHPRSRISPSRHTYTHPFPYSGYRPSDLVGVRRPPLQDTPRPAMLHHGPRLLGPADLALALATAGAPLPQQQQLGKMVRWGLTGGTGGNGECGCEQVEVCLCGMNWTQAGGALREGWGVRMGYVGGWAGGWERWWTSGDPGRDWQDWEDSEDWTKGGLTLRHRGRTVARKTHALIARVT